MEMKYNFSDSLGRRLILIYDRHTKRAIFSSNVSWTAVNEFLLANILKGKNCKMVNEGLQMGWHCQMEGHEIVSAIDKIKKAGLK